jgi:hypothetical protein
MKNFLLLSLIVLQSVRLFAQQWSGANDQTTTITRTGNVGIGTTAPQSKLHVTNGSIMSSDPGYSNINVRMDGTGIPVLRFTRYTGLPNVFHNAFVGQIHDPAYGYGLAFGTGVSTTGDPNTVSYAMTIPLNGTVGIGTTNPRGKFDVDGAGDIYLADDPIAGTVQSIFLPGHMYISPYYGTNVSYFQARRADNSGTTIFQFRTTNNGALTDAMRIEGNGNIGIGTHQATHKLTVNGKIIAEEIQVIVDVPADYVFDNDYKLMPLAEVAKYIQQNKHLPNIQSAEVIKETGWNVGEMNNKMLEKIEELTLYLIELKKQGDELRIENQEIREELKELKSQAK